MTNGAAGIASPVLLFFLLVLAIGAYRAYRMTKGVSASPYRLLTLAGLWVLLFLVLVGGDFALLPIWSIPVEVALLAAGTVVATFHVRRVVVLTEGPPGIWSYRLGFLLPAIYLSALAARLVLDLAVLGSSPFAPPGGSGAVGAPTGFALIALLVVNGLFSASAGLLVGRSIGVLWALRELSAPKGRSGPAG